MVFAFVVLLAAFIIAVPVARKRAAKRTRRQMALYVAFSDYQKAIDPAEHRFMRHSEFFAQQANIAEERLKIAKRELRVTVEFPERFSEEEVAQLQLMAEIALEERDRALALYKTERGQALEQFYAEAQPFLDAISERVAEVEKLTFASAWWFDQPALDLLSQLQGKR